MINRLSNVVDFSSTIQEKETKIRFSLIKPQGVTYSKRGVLRNVPGASFNT